MPQNYKLVINGYKNTVTDRDDVNNKFSALIKKEAPIAEQLLSDGPKTLKSNISLQTANKYKDAIEAIGVDCSVLQIDQATNIDFVPDKESKAHTESLNPTHNNHSDKIIKEQTIDSGNSALEGGQYFTAKWIDKALDVLRKGYFLDFFENNETLLTKYGLYGLYVAAIIGIITAIVIPIKYDALPFSNSIIAGILWVFACIALHYIASKFLPIFKPLLQSTPTRMASSAFLDCFAVLYAVGGIAALVGGIYYGINGKSIEIFISSIFIFIFCEYIVSLCLNPKILNITITNKTTVGEEFLGLISLFLKGFLKLIPIIFGSGIILSILSIITLLTKDYEYISALTSDIFIVISFISAALLPLFGYIIFLFYYFIIDIVSAVLSLPGKLDKLK